MDFLIFLQCFFLLYRSGKGNTECPIAIADLVLLYNKFMEGQYCKGDVLSHLICTNHCTNEFFCSSAHCQVLCQTEYFKMSKTKKT